MITQIKDYAFGIVIVVLLTITGMAKYETYSIEKEYKKYKENINAQLNKAILDKTRIEEENKAKYDKAKADYNADVDRLNDILAGLRKPKTVPRETSVPLAGSSSYSVSEATADTGGTLKASEIEACVKRSSFFALAMQDTLQCSRLIEFVSK